MTEPHQEDRREWERQREKRIEQLERSQEELRTQVTRVMHSVEMMGHDQVSFAKLIEARFTVMEKSQQVADAKLDGVQRELGNLRLDILSMAGDETKSPAGRSLDTKIQALEEKVGTVEHETDAACRELRKEVDALNGYKNRFDGALWLLVVAAPSGVVALLWQIVRALTSP